MRWRLLERLLSDLDPRDRGRCVLVVEELEQREVLSPVVFAPTFSPRTPEGVTIAFTGHPAEGGSSFSVSDPFNDGQPYAADIAATSGVILVDEAAATSFNLAVVNNNTALVTLTGDLGDINGFLTFGFQFTPTAFYSGDATVTLTVTDLTASDVPPGTGQIDVKVDPVASFPNLTLQSFGELRLASEPFAFPAGFVAVDPWPDQDGSESITVTFFLDAPNPDQFTLSAGGVPVVRDDQGFWFLSASTPAELKALLDSLVLTPPTGFTGRASLTATASIRDVASYPSDETTAADGQFTFGGSVALRFFVGGSVVAPPSAALEGGTLDLGGLYAVADPDELPGDFHTLTLSAPRGTLSFNPAAVPAGLSAGRDPSAAGTSVFLTGSLADINAFLATPGSLTYSPGAFYSGLVPLTLTLVNHPGEDFEKTEGDFPRATVQGLVPAPVVAVASLSFAPVASHAFPTAPDVTTDQDTPVALAISVSPLSDSDGSETVVILLEGLPEGSALDRGTDLGGGRWQLSLADLAGLSFTPPPGASGAYTLTVKVVVTDSAPGLGTSDSATEETTFTVTVNPAPVPVPPADPPAVPPTPKLPPPPVDFFVTADVSVPIVLDATVVETTEDTGDESDETETASETAAAFLTNAEIMFSESGLGAPENRVSLSPPGQGSLFTPVESPSPTYASGEKHPLPSVLPLDQTLPVAGFTDSGGDSIALVDKLYRDAGNPDRPPTTPTLSPDAIQPDPENVAVRTVPVVAAVGGNAAPAADLFTQPWFVWASAVGVGMIVGSTLRWYGYGGIITRHLRRIVRGLLKR
jgi:hypothetical protein